MSITGRAQVGEFKPDNLIAGNRHPIDVRHITIKAGQKLVRGSVLEQDTEGKEKYVLRGTRAAKAAVQTEEEVKTETLAEVEAEYILAEDVDASEEDTIGLVYQSGEFAENVLVTKDGYKISEDDRRALRKAGIFLSTIMM